MIEKKERMVLNTKDIPDDVYKILDEQSNKRSLTSFIIKLVEDSLKAKNMEDKMDKIFEKLNSVDNKIDTILFSDFKLSNNEKYGDIEENSLKEGIIIEAENVQGGINESDKIEIDY